MAESSEQIPPELARRRACGNVSTKATSRGTLWRARRSATNRRTCCSDSADPSDRTTCAARRCPNSESTTPVTRDVVDLGVCEEQVLDLTGKHVLTAADDHVVGSAGDEQQTVVEVADVAGRHQTVDHLLRPAAGVALELCAAPHEDPTRRSHRPPPPRRRRRSARSSPAARGRPCSGGRRARSDRRWWPGRPRSSRTGCRDSGPTRSSHSVTTGTGSADPLDATMRNVDRSVWSNAVLASRRCRIAGNHGEDADLLGFDLFERGGRCEGRCDDDRRPERHGDAELCEPPGVEERGR